MLTDPDSVAASHFLHVSFEFAKVLADDLRINDIAFGGDFCLGSSRESHWRRKF
jgi:hypothetical protein